MLSSKRARERVVAGVTTEAEEFAAHRPPVRQQTSSGDGNGFGSGKKRRSQQPGELRLITDVAQLRSESAASAAAGDAWLSVDALGADGADVTVRGRRGSAAAVLRCAVGKHYPAHAPHVAVSAAAGAPTAAGLDVGESLRLRILRSEYDVARAHSSGVAVSGTSTSDEPAHGFAALRLFSDGAADHSRTESQPQPPLRALDDLWLPIHTLLDVARAVRDALEARDA